MSKQSIAQKRAQSKRRGHVTPKEEARGSTPFIKLVEVEASLDAKSVARLNSMAFKQVQTNTKIGQLEATLAKLTDSLTAMSGMVQSELHRIKSRPTQEDAEELFCHKMFTKVSIKLRKRSIDITVEDISLGIKRRRIYRCSDWTRVEHFINYRTLTDGIVELPPRAIRDQSGSKVIKRPNRAATLSDVRHTMERAGESNRILPTKSNKDFIDVEAEAAQKAVNRSRLKAEKVITKLCSRGGAAENATDTELINALEENGFAPEVAYYAALNCGRVTDPAVISKHQPKPTKVAAVTPEEY